MGGVADTPPPSCTSGVPRHISASRQNRLLSAGMPLVEGVGGPILPEDCQDQNHKRKFTVVLLHRIAASLVLPLYGDPGLTMADICRTLRISLATFYRYVALGRRAADHTSGNGGLSKGLLRIE